MAVLANLRAGGRWLADAALVGATGALLAPLITTAAVLLAIRSFAEMRTAKNLERAFAAMLLCFEGNETDQNWTQRQQSIEELRKLTKNETPKEFPTVYLAGIKLLLDGIIKSAESLRTTLSTNGCRLIKEIAIALGASLDPTMLEKLLPAMISLCGHTKSLNKKNGDETVSAIVGNVPVTYRILQHISASSNDKNFSTRMCTAGWLKIVIEKNGRHCEQHGGLDLIDQCIRTGLQDAKPDVREPMRDTYWTFARKWPDRAESIMSSLDAKAQKTLDQHANKLHDIVPPEIKVATTHTTSKTKIAGPTKPSIKDIKLAALRARKVADTTTPENEHGGIITQKPLKEPVTTAPTNKPPVKEMKLAGLRTRKAAETSTTENEDGGVITQNTPKDPIRARKVPETNEDGEAVMTQHPPKDPTSAPIAAPTTAPQTVTQAGPRSTFTVTVGPIRNPSQPTLSSAAPKRALLSSAPVRRPRRPDPATTERGRPRLALDHSAPEVADPDTASRSGSPVNEPPAPSAVEYIADFVTAEPITSIIPVVSGQENDQDALTHKNTWNNKELAERRRSISPRSKNPEEARKLLTRGIERIKARSIDDHGYRKLQGLINYHDRIFQDEQKYDDMLLALLNALETPNTEKRAPLGRRFDNKFQILVTIRLMFVHNRKYFAAYFPRAMAALVAARRNFESRNHIVSGLEETAQDIAAACIPPDVINAVMDVLETEERDEAGSRTIAMGLHILSGLSARMRALQAVLEPQQEQRMAKFALTCLREPTSIVRRAVIEYCLELKRIITPEARFFRLVTGDIEDFKNLITYYAANSMN